MTLHLCIPDEAPAQLGELADLGRQTEALASELREMCRELDALRSEVTAGGFWS